MGKYSEVIKNLTRLDGVAPSRRTLLDEIKRNFKGDLTVDNIAREYVILRAKRDNIKKVLDEHNLNLEAISEMLVHIYESADISTLRLSTGESVSVQPEPHATVVDREKFRLWCIANGLERSLQLHAQTTNALTKEFLLKGKPEPDGIRAYIRDKIVLRKK